MSELEDLRNLYEKLGEREMPEAFRNQIYSMIEQHREEDATVTRGSKRRKSGFFKRMGTLIASGMAVIVALGVVTGVLVQSHKVVPFLGGYQKNVGLNQVPKHVRLTIETFESIDSQNQPKITELTETRQNVFSQPKYHVDMSGDFPIQRSLPHKRGQKFPKIQRLVLSIPASNSFVSFQGYTHSKMVYAKQHLLVVNQQWVFSGTNSLWKTTYTIDASAVEFPKSTYGQTIDSHYVLKYLGKNSSAIGRISYTFSFPQSSYTNHTKLSSSGMISEGGLVGGGLGSRTDYSGEHGTLKLHWGNKNAVIRLKISKPGSES